MKHDFMDKAKGCLVGLAIGDALGIHTEGKTPDEIKKQFGFVSDFLSENPAGSDDTEFALFNALILLKHGKKIDSKIIAGEWREFILPHEGAFKGAGFSQMMAIENLRKGLEPPQTGMHAHSWSDGLAMRVAPFGIIFPGQPEKACALTIEDGSVDHSGEGIYSAMAVVSAISMAMIDASLEKIFDMALNSMPKDSWSYRAIVKGIEIGSTALNMDDALVKLYNEIPSSYYHWADVAPEAVGLSFGLIAASKGNFSDAVLGGVNIGRDTDTIAAIAGAIIGAKIGYGMLPEKWSGKVKTVNGKCIEMVKDIDLVSIASKLSELID
ncbi:MAG: ADP-ribosylglycohydrolase family protein [Bacteroidota bacterium]